VARQKLSGGWLFLCVAFLLVALVNALFNPSVISQARAADPQACEYIECGPGYTSWCCSDGYGGSVSFCFPDEEAPPVECDPCLSPP